MQERNKSNKPVALRTVLGFHFHPAIHNPVSSAQRRSQKFSMEEGFRVETSKASRVWGGCQHPHRGGVWGHAPSPHFNFFATSSLTKTQTSSHQ